MIQFVQFFILLGIFGSVVDGGSLYTVDLGDSKPPACCEGDDIRSCERVDINATTLGDEGLELESLQEILQFKGMLGDTNTTYHYSNEEADMIITYYTESDIALGNISMGNGESFVIEHCGRDDGHVLKEFKVDNSEEDQDTESEDGDSRMKRNVEDERNSGCILYNQYRYYGYRYIGIMSQPVCRWRCRISSSCVGWAHYDRYNRCYLLTAYSRYWAGMAVGPNLGNSVCMNNWSRIPVRNSILVTRYSMRAFTYTPTSCSSLCYNRSYCQLWRWYRYTCYGYNNYFRYSFGWTSGNKYA